AAVPAHALRHVARGAAAAPEVGPGEGQVEGADVSARIDETRRAVGEAVERERAGDRLPVELRLEAAEALAGGMQMKRVARGQPDGEALVQLDDAGRRDRSEPGKLVPVTVRLEEDLPPRRRAAQRQARLAGRARGRTAILRGRDRAPVPQRDGGC